MSITCHLGPDFASRKTGAPGTRIDSNESDRRNYRVVEALDFLELQNRVFKDGLSCFGILVCSLSLKPLVFYDRHCDSLNFLQILFLHIYVVLELNIFTISTFIHTL